MRPFPWFPESVRSAAEKTFSGEHVKSVPEVMSALRLYSDNMIRKKLGQKFYENYFPSTRSGGSWKAGHPIGVVDHYTAAPSVEGTLRWFSNYPRDPGSGDSSAHIVIDRTGEIYIIINPLQEVAWHAKKANFTHVGIEHVNTGFLEQRNGKFFFMGYLPYPSDKQGLVGVDDYGEHWECYSVPQIISNIVLKRWLIDWFPMITRKDMVDHSYIDPVRKRDCGPLWPLDRINDLVVSWADLSKLSWLDCTTVTPEVVKTIQYDL